MQLWRRPPVIYIQCLRAAIAITLGGVLLPFIRSYEKAFAQPSTLTWTVIVCIMACPGKTIGGCMEAIWQSTVGLGIGCLVFWCLSKLGKAGSPVGQGIVFAIVVYLFALIRYQGPKYIPVYLVGVLFSFQGIYSQVISEEDTSVWLLGYFQAFAVGLGVVLVVNILVLPTTSEKELRDLIVSSLQHVSTLAHLACKTYARDIGADEKEVRDLLIQTIRSDFSALSTRLDEASYEILWSRFTMSDYRQMIAKVRGLQQALITSSSSLDLILTLDPGGVNLRHMAKPEFTSAFADFRHGADLVIAEIVDVLVGVTMADLEKKSDGGINKRPADVESQMNYVPSVVSSVRATQNLPTISARLRAEVLRSVKRQERLRSDSRQGAYTPTQIESRQSAAMRVESRQSHVNVEKPAKSVGIFMHAWEEFAADQAQAITQLIKDEALAVDDVLRITAGAPSLHTLYSERLPKAWASTLVHETALRRLQPKKAEEHGAPADSFSPDEPEEEPPCSEALTKSYSLLFGLGQYTEELCALHAIAMAPRTRSLRFHIFEDSFKNPWRRDPESMTLQEALAALAGAVYHPPRVNFFERFAHMEAWFRSDRSLYALKVALGATIYSLLLLCKTPRPFYIQYGATSSLITVIVAISPSMGQTLKTFVLQLFGTGVGSLYGMICLEMFKNLGGYKYNPYGMTVFYFIWAFASSWHFYTTPRYYSGALLATNGAATIMVSSYQHASVPSQEGPYPDPPLRLGYSIASMGISILIAAVFQIVIFRVPARRQLRLKIAAITFGLSSYNTILQSNINAVAPADFRPIPPQDAVQKIQKELINRETKLQADIIALTPLWGFAHAEPQFLHPFHGDVLLKIIKSHQIILDRLREARTAVGMHGFSYTVHHDFVSTLFPYRLHSQRLARTLFYLSATSILSKTPLPRDVPSSRSTWRSFEHDALLLSRRLSKLPHGDEELRKPGFLRYWFYLVSVGSVSEELEKLEEYLGELFGVPEVTNPNIS